MGRLNGFVDFAEHLLVPIIPVIINLLLRTGPEVSRQAGEQGPAAFSNEGTATYLREEALFGCSNFCDKAVL
jgi:hypothetical protein